MRPPEFTGGNLVALGDRALVAVASMRPPEFTGGNPTAATLRHERVAVLQ